MVYIDVYYMWNLLMNFWVLSLTGWLRKYPGTWKRRMGAAALGAAAAIVPLCVRMPLVIEGAALPLAESLAMCRIAYRPENGRQLLTQGLWLWLITWIMGGMMNWIYYHTGLGYGIQKALAGQGTPASAVWLGAAAAASGIGLLAVRRKYQKEQQENTLLPVILYYRGKTVTVTALADTGNRLKTAYGAPVSLIGPETAQKLLEEQELALIKTLAGKDTEEGNKETMEKGEPVFPEKLMLIPYRSVGRKHGLLPAVRIDRAEVCCPSEHHITEHAVIAVSQEKLTESGGYEMILHTGLL